MATATFDSLGYFEKLRAAGVSDEQAKVQASAFREFVAEQEEARKRELATKGELMEMELRLTAEIHKSRAETIKWVVGVLLAQFAAIAALIKL